MSASECKSVDFGNMGSCLINYVNRNDTQLTIGCDLKNNEIWDYYEIIDDSECLSEKPKPSANEDVCLNEPTICRNGGNCQSVPLDPPQQSFTHECHCPVKWLQLDAHCPSANRVLWFQCNWCGKHCDKRMDRFDRFNLTHCHCSQYEDFPKRMSQRQCSGLVSG